MLCVCSAGASSFAAQSKTKQINWIEVEHDEWIAITCSYATTQRTDLFDNVQ